MERELESLWQILLKSIKLNNNDKFLEILSREYTSCFRDLDELLLSDKEGTASYLETCIFYAFCIFSIPLKEISSSRACKYFELLDTVLVIYGPNREITNVIDKSVFLRTLSLSPFQFPEYFNDEYIFYDNKHEKISIRKLKDPSLNEFTEHMLNPIIIENIISHWPALKKWKRPSFWTKIAGHRFFPVEIGENYLDENWSQKIIQLNEYFEHYVFSSANKVTAYIAQHNWLHQIPLLAQDFETPDVCDLFSNSDYNNRVLTHMWFGMTDTFTPMHFDKYNNLFTQVVGSKHFIIVDPKYSSFLTNGTDNNCKINRQDLLKFLDSNKIYYYDFVLHSGESLYIPSQWWHQVRSLTFSISISFWF